MKKEYYFYFLSLIILVSFIIPFVQSEESVKVEIFVLDSSTTKNIVDISKIVLTDSNGNIKKPVIEQIGELNTKEFAFYNLDGVYKIEVSADGYTKYELDGFIARKNEGLGTLTISLDPLFRISCEEKSKVSKRIMAGTVNEINNLKIILNGLKDDDNLAIITAGRSSYEEELNFTKDISFQKINLENQDYSIFLESVEENYATFQVFCGNADEYINSYRGFGPFFGKLFCKLKNISSKGNRYICILDKALNSAR